METFAEFQRRKNFVFYSSKGGRIYSSFRTFAHSQKFAEANAVEFAEKAPKKGKLRVYEIGVGDGSFASNFMKELKRIDEEVAERTIYALWDFSEKGVRLAAEKIWDFRHEEVVAPAWDLRKMKRANCVKCSELLDDLPTRMLVRRGMRMMEIMQEGAECRELKVEVGADIYSYMKRMPTGYWVPIPEMGLECILWWKKKLCPSGWIDVFDYGFSDVKEIRALPQDIWNATVMRQFSGQITVDVNFAFLKRFAGGRIEPQKDYVERALRKELWEVDIDSRLDYYSYEEIRKNANGLEKEGYDIKALLAGLEKSEYFHMEIAGRSY